MPTILISYRRSDSSAITGRIFDHLTAYYGDESVFMDVDNVPVGINFRTYILETLRRTDVVVAVIGSNWLGVGADGAPRILEPTDAVRVEIETALAQKTPIIPVLVDRARMPDSSDLPEELGDFVDINAAEVTTGRDFRMHVDRLIGAIDHTLSGKTAADTPGRTRPGFGRGKKAQKLGLGDLLHYLAVPLVLLLAVHHVVVNAFDLKVEYLWIACGLIPFAFGFIFYWATNSGAGAAFGFAVALGLIAVIGMDVSQSLNSGDPLMPQGRSDWRDNIQLLAAISFSYLVGHALARALRAMRAKRLGKI